jgi:hypothetical protein
MPSWLAYRYEHNISIIGIDSGGKGQILFLVTPLLLAQIFFIIGIDSGGKGQILFLVTPLLLAQIFFYVNMLDIVSKFCTIHMLIIIDLQTKCVVIFMMWLHTNFRMRSSNGFALSPLLFSFTLECAIRKDQENQVGPNLNETLQLLGYADDVNLSHEYHKEKL